MDSASLARCAAEGQRITLVTAMGVIFDDKVFCGLEHISNIGNEKPGEIKKILNKKRYRDGFSVYAKVRVRTCRSCCVNLGAWLNWKGSITGGEWSGWSDYVPVQCPTYDDNAYQTPGVWTPLYGTQPDDWGKYFRWCNRFAIRLLRDNGIL